MTPRVKICCISSVVEASTAISMGAHALGLVSEMPSGPGTISNRLISEITKTIPPGVDSFLLTKETDGATIIEQHRLCRTSTIQLVDRVEPQVRETLQKELPGISIVQVVHVLGTESIPEAQEAGINSDAILLDSGNPNKSVKELGGTGRVHDWAVSREIVQVVDRPVYLAGGIGPDNVEEAWYAVRPFGFDLCSSVRINDQLDAGRLEQLMQKIGSLK